MQGKQWYKNKLSVSGNLSTTCKQQIENDFEMAIGKPFASQFSINCKNKYHDAIILILRTMGLKERGGYTLRAGITIYKNGKYYHNGNLTAKIAQWWIGQDPSNIKYFSEVGKEYADVDESPTKV